MRVQNGDNFQYYIQNNFIIDYAGCTDILATLTTLILKKKLFHHRLHWLCCCKKLLLTIQSLMSKLIFRSKQKFVITDYVDYLVLHVAITYIGIFSRKFSVVSHASPAKRSHYNANFQILAPKWNVRTCSKFVYDEIIVYKNLLCL